MVLISKTGCGGKKGGELAMARGGQAVEEQYVRTWLVAGGVWRGVAEEWACSSVESDDVVNELALDSWTQEKSD